jgi:adenine phosphoribosyltransferase
MTSGALDAQVRQAIRPIPDHPKPGIVFQDITPVLQDSALFRQVIHGLIEPFRGHSITHILGIEARGFILGAPVAVELGAGFIPARKPGKLPWKTRRHDYALEYGTDSLEAHEDAFAHGARVLVVDDVLATGGTAQAAASLVRLLGAELIGWSFLLELDFLHGRERLTGAPVEAISRL